MKQIKRLIILLLLPASLTAKINIVASTSDLAYLANQIGGDKVEVSYIAPPATDIHHIEARPSYFVKLSKADVALKIGLELDLWMEQVIDGSRNNHLSIVDCSKYVKPLEVPAFKADARHGDLHRYGNPHYWLSPANVKPVTDAIVESLSLVDAEYADDFVTNQERLLEQISEIVRGLQPKLEKLKGIQMVYYHNSWPYFNEFAGTVSASFVESFPGVPPSPSQIKKLIDQMKSGNIKIIAMEPYFDKRVPEKISLETGAKVVTLYPSIGGRKKDESYQEWLEKNIDALIEALHE